MPQKQLTIDSLRDLDFGLVSTAFETELQRVVKDLQDRPTDGKPRKVALIFVLKSMDDHADDIDCECEVVASIPKRVSKPYRMRAKQDGSLYFQPEAPENADQMVIDDEIERRMKTE